MDTHTHQVSVVEFTARVRVFHKRLCTMRLRKLFRISCWKHETNEWVRSKINFLAGPQEPPLATVWRRKLAWFGHVTRRASPSETILHGTFYGGRRRGRQRKCCKDNIKEWTSLPVPELLTRVSCRKDWKGVSAESFFMTPLMTRSVKGLK